MDAREVRAQIFGHGSMEYWQDGSGAIFAVKRSAASDGVDYPVLKVCGPIPPGEATADRLVRAHRNPGNLPWALPGWTMHWEEGVNAATGAWEPEYNDPEDRVIGSADLRRFLQGKRRLTPEEIA